MKHTYLIIAHHNLEQLKILISMLDDTRNDIFLHIDKKWKDFNFNSISCAESGMYYTQRIEVNWGGITN